MKYCDICGDPITGRAAKADSNRRTLSICRDCAAHLDSIYNSDEGEEDDDT